MIVNLSNVLPQLSKIINVFIQPVFKIRELDPNPCRWRRSACKCLIIFQIWNSSPVVVLTDRPVLKKSISFRYGYFLPPPAYSPEYPFRIFRRWIFEANVVGGIRSLSAAPPAPATLPLQVRRIGLPLSIGKQQQKSQRPVGDVQPGDDNFAHTPRG